MIQKISLMYLIWLLSGHGGNTLHPNTTQVITAKLDGGSNSHVFTGITILTYIRHVKCNVQILNGRKTPAKCFGLAMIKKKNIIIPFFPSYYMPQKLAKNNQSNCTKNYNRVRNFRTESLRWLKITTDTGM